MNRRDFLAGLFLWILAFFFGYTARKEGENLPLIGSDESMVRSKDSKTALFKAVPIVYVEEYENLKVAVSDGYDWTAAYQAAFNEILTRGGGEVILPNEDCIITSTITYLKKANSSGIRVRGTGSYSTKIINRVPNGYCFSINGSYKSTNFTHWFAYNTVFEDLQIVGDPAVLNCGGIYIQGSWLSEINRCRITGHTGDAITIGGDETINDDYSSSALLNIEGCFIVNNGGWGINCENGFSPDRTLIQRNIINNNKKGGIKGSQNGLHVISNSISGNGATDKVGGGLWAYPRMNQHNNWIIENNEFDDNYNFHINLEGSILTAEIRLNRFITNYINGDIRPLRHIIVGNPTGYSVKLLTIRNNTFFLNGDVASTGQIVKFVDVSSKGVGTRIQDNAYNISAPNILGIHVLDYVDSGTNTTVIDDTGKYMVSRADKFNSSYTSLQNDMVLVLKPGRKIGLMAITCNGNADHSGIVIYRADKNPTCTALNVTESTLLNCLNDTILKGTTGTNGKINISTDDNGNVYIENRGGGMYSDVSITFL